MSKPSINRREFLQLSASAAAMLGLTGCAGVKINPLAWMRPRRPRPIAPGAKIRFANIGLSGKGYSDVRDFADEHTVALCDTNWDQKEVKETFAAFPNAKRYKDFRKMLLELDDEIDAVVVSIPDHMHFLAAYMAISMGKHVYVQKPLTQTVGEARELLKLARRHGVCTQMGNQGHAGDGIRMTREWIQAGLIGPVHEVHIWCNRPIWPQAMIKPPEPKPIPENLAWDLWLGHADTRPYGDGYQPFVWRGWRDFGSGALGDMGCHLIDGPFWALDLGSPLSVEAEFSGLTDLAFPEWSIITYQFSARGAMPPLTLKWYDGGKMPPRPKDLEASRDMKSECGSYMLGGKATLFDTSSYSNSPRVIPEAKMKELRPLLPKKTIPRGPGNPNKELTNAIRANNPALAGSNFEYSVPLTETVLLGNLAIFAGKKIEWDGPNMRVTNCPAVNKFVNPTYRKGWKPRDLA